MAKNFSNWPPESRFAPKPRHSISSGPTKRSGHCAPESCAARRYWYRDRKWPPHANVRLVSFRSPLEQKAHGLVTELGEILVELPHAPEPIGCEKNHGFVGRPFDLGERFRRDKWTGHDNISR